MNVEAFSYSIMASVLGILIVFLSLVGLCLLMVALKFLFSDKEKPASASEATVPTESAGVSAVPRENTDWIMAAVAAFLMEEDGVPPSAAAWGPKSSEIADPWMNNAAFEAKLG